MPKKNEHIIEDILSGELSYDEFSKEVSVFMPRDNTSVSIAQVDAWDYLVEKGSRAKASKWQGEIGEFVSDAISEKAKEDKTPEGSISIETLCKTMEYMMIVGMKKEAVRLCMYRMSISQKVAIGIVKRKEWSVLHKIDAL